MLTAAFLSMLSAYRPCCYVLHTGVNLLTSELRYGGQTTDIQGDLDQHTNQKGAPYDYFRGGNVLQFTHLTLYSMNSLLKLLGLTMKQLRDVLTELEQFIILVFHCNINMNELANTPPRTSIVFMYLLDPIANCLKLVHIFPIQASCQGQLFVDRIISSLFQHAFKPGLTGGLLRSIVYFSSVELLEEYVVVKILSVFLLKGIVTKLGAVTPLTKNSLHQVLVTNTLTGVTVLYETVRE